MKRRDLLRYGVMFGGTAAAQMMFPRIAFGQATGANQRFVFVFLRGGADVVSFLPPGLSTPAHDVLSAARTYGNFAITGNNRIQTGKAFDIHAQLKPMFYAAGSSNFLDGVNVVLQTGSMNETRSHFEQQDLMESGSRTTKQGEGFLAKVATQQSRKALAVGPKLPYSLRGLATLAFQNEAALTTTLATGKFKDGLDLTDRLQFTIDSNRDKMGQDIVSAATRAKAEFQTISAACAAVSPIVGNRFLANGQSADAQNAFEEDCILASRILRSSVAPSIMTINFDGWDTHKNQGTVEAISADHSDGSFSGKARCLARGLSKLRHDLETAGLWQNTTIVVTTEFGRTIRSNFSEGTDHGRAAAMFVLGGSVKSLAQSTANIRAEQSWNIPASGVGASSALVVRRDWRDIVAEVLYKKFGLNNPGSVLPGWNGQYLGILS